MTRPRWLCGSTVQRYFPALFISTPFPADWRFHTGLIAQNQFAYEPFAKFKFCKRLKGIFALFFYLWFCNLSKRFSFSRVFSVEAFSHGNDRVSFYACQFFPFSVETFSLTYILCCYRVFLYWIVNTQEGRFRQHD